MIFIKENQLVNSNIIPSNERVIGVKNTNNVETREFVFPSLFKQLNLVDDSFVFLLNIDPVNSEELSYSHALEKSIVDDMVYLSWKITRTHTKDSGNLNVTIQILNSIGDIVWESFKLEFTVVDGISATESIEEIPQNVLEQLVMQSGAYAQIAKVEADRAKAEADRIEGQIFESSGHTLVDGDGNELPQRKNLQFMTGVVLEDDENNDVTKVFVTGSGTGTISEDDHSKLRNLSYANSGHTGFAPSGNYAVVTYNNSNLEFPNQGDSKNLYIDMSSNKMYRWDSLNLKYFELGASFDDIKIISGGNAGG